MILVKYLERQNLHNVYMSNDNNNNQFLVFWGGKEAYQSFFLESDRRFSRFVIGDASRLVLVLLVAISRVSRNPRAAQKYVLKHLIVGRKREAPTRFYLLEERTGSER